MSTAAPIMCECCMRCGANVSNMLRNIFQCHKICKGVPKRTKDFGKLKVRMPAIRMIWMNVTFCFVGYGNALLQAAIYWAKNRQYHAVAIVLFVILSMKYQYKQIWSTRMFVAKITKSITDGVVDPVLTQWKVNWVCLQCMWVTIIGMHAASTQDGHSDQHKFTRMNVIAIVFCQYCGLSSIAREDVQVHFGDCMRQLGEGILSFGVRNDKQIDADAPPVEGDVDNRPWAAWPQEDMETHKTESRSDPDFPNVESNIEEINGSYLLAGRDESGNDIYEKEENPDATIKWDGQSKWCLSCGEHKYFSPISVSPSKGRLRVTTGTWTQADGNECITVHLAFKSFDKWPPFLVKGMCGFLDWWCFCQSAAFLSLAAIMANTYCVNLASSIKGILFILVTCLPVILVHHKDMWELEEDEAYDQDVNNSYPSLRKIFSMAFLQNLPRLCKRVVVEPDGVLWYTQSSIFGFPWFDPAMNQLGMRPAEPKFYAHLLRKFLSAFFIYLAGSSFNKNFWQPTLEWLPYLPGGGNVTALEFASLCVHVAPCFFYHSKGMAHIANISGANAIKDSLMNEELCQKLDQTDGRGLYVFILMLTMMICVAINLVSNLYLYARNPFWRHGNPPQADGWIHRLEERLVGLPLPSQMTNRLAYSDNVQDGWVNVLIALPEEETDFPHEWNSTECFEFRSYSDKYRSELARARQPDGALWDDVEWDPEYLAGGRGDVATESTSQPLLA